jgi:hypothetical protein
VRFRLGVDRHPPDGARRPSERRAAPGQESVWQRGAPTISLSPATAGAPIVNGLTCLLALLPPPKSPPAGSNRRSRRAGCRAAVVDLREHGVDRDQRCADAQVDVAQHIETALDAGSLLRSLGCGVGSTLDRYGPSRACRARRAPWTPFATPVTRRSPSGRPSLPQGRSWIQASTAVVTCSRAGRASSSVRTTPTALTTAGSNWVPAQRRSSFSASLVLRQG